MGATQKRINRALDGPYKDPPHLQISRHPHPPILPSQTMMQSFEDSAQPRDRRPWTEEEDDKLRSAIEEEDPDANPPSRWHAIAQHIPNRTNKDCRKRWWAQMATVVSKGSWTSDEDERLFTAVEELGPKWAVVAGRVRTRNSGQCAKRWNDALNPLIDRSGWTPEEDDQLLKAVKLLGHSWAHIARTCLPGRTGLAAKNRYNHLIRGSSERLVGGRGVRVSAMHSSRRRTRGNSASSSSMCSPHSSSQTRLSMSNSSSASSSAPSTPEPVTEHDDAQFVSAPDGLSPGNSMDEDMHSMILNPSVHPSFSPFPQSDSPNAESQIFNLFMNTAFCSEPSASSAEYTPPFDIYDTPGSFSDVDPFSTWTNFFPEANPLEQIAFPHPPAAYSHHSSPLLSSQVIPNKATGPQIVSAGVDYFSMATSPQPSRYPSPTLREFPSLVDAQVTIDSVPSMPDRASIQVTQPTPDPSDRRVAVAVAICDRQDIGSTVQSLSQSLSAILCRPPSPVSQ